MRLEGAWIGGDADSLQQQRKVSRYEKGRKGEGIRTDVSDRKSNPEEKRALVVVEVEVRSLTNSRFQRPNFLLSKIVDVR